MGSLALEALDAFRDGAYRFVRGTGNSFWDFIDMAASGTSDQQTLESDRRSFRGST